MPWGARMSFGKIALILIEVLLPMFSNAVDCNTTIVKVGKPEVYYAVNGELFVSWMAEKGLSKYSVNLCCIHDPSQTSTCNNLKIPNCPHDDTMSDCYFDEKTNHNKCKKLVAQLNRYKAYISAELYGCKFRSDVVSIIPTLDIAHSFGVERLTVDSKNDGLQLQWTKPIESVGLEYRYYFYCHKMDGDVRGKQVQYQRNKTKHFMMHIPFTGGRHGFKTYECCVRSQLSRTSSDNPLSNEVCNRTITPAIVPAEPPIMLCGYKNECSTLVKDNMRNVTLHWKLPDKSSWNGILEGVIVEVRKAHNDNVTTYFLNGTKTEYTLTGLRTDTVYHVDLKLCTNGGCSTIGTPLVLKALPTNSDDSGNKKGKSGWSSEKVWTVLVSCGIALVLFIGLACWVFFNFRRNSGQVARRLPHLHPPDADPACSGESVATSLRVNTSDYDIVGGRRRRLEDCDNSDTSSQRTLGNGDDCGSLQSWDSDSPLLTANDSESSNNLGGKKNVVVTYLPQQPRAVSYVKQEDSDDESAKFL